MKYAILRSDKGNGTVIITKDEYKLCMTVLFSDNNKFKKVTKDTTLTQLTTLQNYLHTIKSRDEITQDKHETMRPTVLRSR